MVDSMVPAAKAMAARNTNPSRRFMPEPLLEKMESYFDGRVNRNGFSVLHTGLEQPLFDRFDSLRVEPQPQLLLDFDVPRMARLVDNDLQLDRTLPLRFARFFRVFRLNLFDN